MADGADRAPERSATDAPFEWLTNFRSLRHLVLPSRMRDDASETSCDVRPPALQLNALHVGCGTSTAGESLLLLRERTYSSIMRYGRVVNVDNDERALESMCRRWETLQTQSNEEEPAEERGTMVWKCLDFKSDQSCRLALDEVYRELMQNEECTEVGGCFDFTEPGGCFDLALDKSTLDCLLCAETSVVAQFLCEVYRALRVPSANCNAPSWGGVYVLVTFHPVEFVKRLLTELPGADWSVEHEVIRREVEDVNERRDCKEVDEVSQDSTASGGVGIQNDPIGPAFSAWSSGTFHPDENYRKTVNVFTCRRRSSQVSNKAMAERPTYILDRDRVLRHIERVCDEWYQQTNPMVTDEREKQLRNAFREAANKESNEMVDLKRCYKMLFTAAEKEHLSYEYFLEDWSAYYERLGDNGNQIYRDSMTVDTALDFLKEMQ
ncbi:hypothetical protein ACHAXT_002877 [Thalassiosira profunda]